jgi:hypothetical protein
MNANASLTRRKPALAQGQRPSARRFKEYPLLNQALDACWEAGAPIVKIPVPAVVIVLTADSLQQMWLEHLIRWSYYYEPLHLEKIARALQAGQRITPPEQEYLKDLKNVGDDLRGIFQLFSVGHQIPKPIQALVKMVGQLRDQVRLEETARARSQARELLALLARAGKIDWPELQVDPKAMGGFLRERIAGMQQLLGRKNLTARDFHQIKKDFRLVFSVYYCLNPRLARLPPKRNVFLTTKRLIKKMNRLLLEQKYWQNFKYRQAIITLPVAFRSFLSRFLSAVNITTRALRRPSSPRSRLT